MSLFRFFYVFQNIHVVFSERKIFFAPCGTRPWPRSPIWPVSSHPRIVRKVEAARSRRTSLAEMSISGGLVNHAAIHIRRQPSKRAWRAKMAAGTAAHSRPWWSDGGRGRPCSTAVAAAYRGVLKSERCIVHRRHRRLREQACRFLDGLRAPAPERDTNPSENVHRLPRRRDWP